MVDETQSDKRKELILQTMVAIAGADGRLVESETETICRLYQQLTGDEIAPSLTSRGWPRCSRSPRTAAGTLPLISMAPAFVKVWDRSGLGSNEFW